MHITGARRGLRLFAVTAALAGVLPGGGASAVAAEETGASSQLKELDPMPMVWRGTRDTGVNPDRSGWMIFDTKNRFAYQIHEGGTAGTIVQSFDLDTLRPRRRAILSGVPVTAGIAATDATGGSLQGEVVHAVDEERGRLYLAMSEVGNLRATATIGATDGKRPLTRFVMIDEFAFDRCAGQAGCAFARSFREPSTQPHLHYFYLMSMTVPRADKLLLAFAHPGTSTFNEQSTTPLYAHTVAQWDTASMGPTGLQAPRAGDEARGEASAETQPLVDPGEMMPLELCARTTMASQKGFGEGQLGWEILPTADAVYVGCHLAAGNGAVVEVPLGPGGSLLGGGPVRTYPLAKEVAEVLVDPGGRRLLLKAVENTGTNTGTTVWVFDTGKRRYTGAVALNQSTGFSLGMGVDPATGRLYALVPDHLTAVGGRPTPVRGGLQLSDTRLDPAPPLSNLRPELAYTGFFRILVDPPTRRVFVRRGHGSTTSRIVYPCTSLCAPAPTEPFYRVFRDDVPVLGAPAEIDDSVFTTDVPEGELTTASYLGSGSGFGARSLLVGGLDPLTNGAAGQASPSCGKEDRELLAGAVGQVSLSDLSASATAASLEGDARLMAASPDLVDNCRHPSARDSGGDTERLAFDEADPATGKRTGENHYQASCLGDEGTRGPRGFREDRRHDDGFDARATCDRKGQRAEGQATGAVALEDAAQVTVGRAESKVTTVRAAGRGARVTVDSTARDVEIPGAATIAVVRTETTSTATGRRGGAGASFRRTICGVTVEGRMNQPGCLGPEQEKFFVESLNQALGARGRARLREPDAGMLAGSASGYRASVERDADDVFEDRSVTKDLSPAVPGLELMFFQGDGEGGRGTGRQLVQLAAGQASTSYGIACLFGQKADGKCAKEGESFTPAEPVPSFGGNGSSDDGDTGAPGEPIVTTITETLPGESALPVIRIKESFLTKMLRAPVRALAEAMQLLFNNPRELALLGAVWLLLYAPFHLGERYRNVRRIRARSVV